MKKKNKQYLILGLLLLIASLQYATDESTYTDESLPQDTTPTEQTPQEQKETDLQTKIDQELFDLFEKFFDKEDQTPFTQFINKAITLLKAKRNTLHGDLQIKCDKIIKSFEQNKHNLKFPIWLKILIDPELLDLMSPETREYIHNISACVKIQTLMTKLNANPHH